MSDATLRILTVCTGNICRSPVAERLLQAALGDTVEISSAGVRAMIGDPIHPEMGALMDRWGVPPDGFVARQLTPVDVRSADLVLTLTRQHRAQLVQEAPSAVRRSFTLLEFARIVTSPDLPPVAAGPIDVRLRELVPLAARHRPLAGPAGSHDVPDPYGRDRASYEVAYALIRDAVGAIARAARG